MLGSYHRLAIGILFSIVLIVFWHHLYIDTPIGFRPYQDNFIAAHLRSLLFCNDMPHCLRIGIAIPIFPIYFLVDFLREQLHFAADLDIKFTKVYMTILFFLISFFYLKEGRPLVQIVTFFLFIINPYFHPAVGITQFDIATLAFWSFFIYYAETVLESKLLSKILVLMCSALIYENNGIILGFLFWSFESARYYKHRCKLDLNFLIQCLKFGIIYLTASLIPALLVVLAVSLVESEPIFFVERGKDISFLFEIYGNNNSILLTLSRVIQFNALAIIPLIAFLWASKFFLKTRVHKHNAIIEKFSTKTLVIATCAFGFCFTIAVGHFISGIIWEWPRQFLPLSFLMFCLFSSIVNDTLNIGRENKLS